MGAGTGTDMWLDTLVVCMAATKSTGETREARNGLMQKDASYEHRAAPAGLGSELQIV